MAKWVHNDVLDAALKEVAKSTRLYVCSNQPSTFAEASSDYKLAEKTLVPGDGNGVFTIADGDSTGRKVTIAAQTIASASASGTATHVALADASNSKLLAVTTLPSAFDVVSGNAIAVPAFAVRNPMVV